MYARSLIAAAAAAMLIESPAAAQKLHVNPRWKECSFQIDPSLTQSAWRMGRGNFEVSALDWQTGIHRTDSAWNDTFVHPDSDHVLFEGSRLAFPGLMVRAGLASSTDLAVYATKNPNANYGFYGANIQ